MEYHGKLYGSVAGEHFDTGKTSQQYDDLLEACKVGLEAIKELHQFQDGWEEDDEKIRAAIKKALN
jgi:hypothetical protein